jgi:hypothetical protein
MDKLSNTKPIYDLEESTFQFAKEPKSGQKHGQNG